MDLGLGYRKAFIIHAKGGSWVNLNGVCHWVSFNYQPKKTVWYIVAETLMANGNKTFDEDWKTLLSSFQKDLRQKKKLLTCIKRKWLESLRNST